MKILAVLLNPTIDQIYEIEDFYVGGTFLVKNSIIYPVGKAISFSLSIRQLTDDEDILKVIACIGKEDIPLYAKFLSSRKIDFQFIEIEGKTRSNKTVNDPIKGTTTHIRERGFQLDSKDLEMVRDLIKINIEERDIVLFSGSLPPNVSDDIYFELINLVKEHKGRAILDTSVEPLIKAVKANPLIIKPNQVEFSQILNKPEINDLDLSNITDSCDILVKEARALINDELKTILITLGDKGAICITKDSAMYGIVNVENVIDTTGCGDAFFAGFALNYLLEKNLQECFKMAIACGAANTLIPGPGIFKFKSVEKILQKVEIKELD